MPLLCVVAVRLSLIHLVVGFTLGAMLMINHVVPEPLFPVPGGMLAHLACAVFGWSLQLAVGVSFWILPRFPEGPPRGDERPAWAAIALLNLGVLLSFAGFNTAMHVIEAAGALAYARHLWPRIRPYLMTPHPSKPA